MMREASLYSAGAAAALAVDMGLLAFQVEVLEFNYLLAATSSFIVGTAVVYWVSVRHAFSYRRLRQPGLEFAVFAGIGVLGILVNLGVIYSAVEIFTLHYLLAKVLAAGFTFVMNFALRRLFLFTRLTPGKFETGGDR